MTAYREIGITFPLAKPAASRKHARRLMAYYRLYQRAPWWRRMFMEKPIQLADMVYMAERAVLMEKGRVAGNLVRRYKIVEESDTGVRLSTRPMNQGDKNDTP
jgi:hypothetical protein